MAGSGRPYDALTDLRRQLIRALHDGYSTADIQDIFSLSRDELLAELNSLAEASLVKKSGQTYQPNFFVANAEETQRAVEYADGIGKQLFAQLSEDWDDLTNTIQQLEIAQKFSMQDIVLVLIGANILDLGLLEVLARDGTLLPPAPHRPAPHTPDAHYYFWMIEGEADALGKYGQRTMGLPHDGWCFFTFGRYELGHHDNKTRRTLEQDVLHASDTLPSAEQLGSQFDIPLFTAQDISRWSPVVINECERLLAVYKENDSSIRSHYATLKASEYSDFAEFFCWFDHVAYSSAIDLLEEAELITIPESHFAAALWEGGMGPTFFGMSTL